MAATANIVYVSVCDQSKMWIEEQLKHPTDKLGLVLASNKKCSILPAKMFEQIFDEHGYGKDKTKKWLDRWVELDKIGQYSYSTREKYIYLPTCKIKESEYMSIISAIETIKAEDLLKMEAIKAEAAAKVVA